MVMTMLGDVDELQKRHTIEKINHRSLCSSSKYQIIYFSTSQTKAQKEERTEIKIEKKGKVEIARNWKKIAIYKTKTKLRLKYSNLQYRSIL